MGTSSYEGGSPPQASVSTVERLVRLETEHTRLATKADVKDIKIWLLSSVMGVFVGGGGIVFALTRLLD